MNYSRKKDDGCIKLCEFQARLFERASKNHIPSAYFVKIFVSSSGCIAMDDLEALRYPLSEEGVYINIKNKVKMNRGTILPTFVMSWIGYLLRQWAYTYNVRSKVILKKVPLSYLFNVYPSYHALDIQKAIILIAEDRNIDLNEKPETRLYNIIKRYTVL